MIYDKWPVSTAYCKLDDWLQNLNPIGDCLMKTTCKIIYCVFKPGPKAQNCPLTSKLSEWKGSIFNFIKIMHGLAEVGEDLSETFQSIRFGDMESNLEKLSS